MITTDELAEYNKIIINVSKEVARPWKQATYILALLLLGMIALYFLNPSTVDLDANNNNDSNITQKG